MNQKIHGRHTEYKTEFRALSEPSEAAGKTITNTLGEEYDDTLILTFSDKTYLYITAIPEDEDSAELRYEYRNPNADDALKMGLIDQAEFDRSGEEYLAKSEAHILEYKLKQYEKLKKELADAGLPKPAERTTCDRDCDPDIHGY